MRYSEQFDIFEIITNGTTIPNRRVLEMMELYKDKMYVMIDHYGESSFNAKALDQLLSSIGINHSVRKYHGQDAHMGGWVDLGDYTHKHSIAKAQMLYEKCVIANKPKQRTGVYNPVTLSEDTCYIPYMAMTDGVLHRCARSYSTMQAGSIGIHSENFVDIMNCDNSVVQIRDEICSLYLQKYLSACEFCNGFSEKSKRYMPAEQLVGARSYSL